MDANHRERVTWRVLLGDLFRHTLLVLFVGVPLLVAPGIWLLLRMWDACWFHSRFAASWTVGVSIALVMSAVLVARLLLKGAPKGRIAVSLLPGVLLAGLVFGWAAPDFLHALDRGHQKRTISDIRTLATAVESYRVDRGGYPLLSDLEELARVLENLGYVRECPVRDRWGNPFLVDTNGRGHVIVSYGRCGVPQQEDPWTYPCAAFEGFEEDTLYRSGRFVRYPCCGPVGPGPGPCPCPPGMSGAPPGGPTVLGWGGEEESNEE